MLPLLEVPQEPRQDEGLQVWYQLSGSQCDIVEGAGASHSDLGFFSAILFTVWWWLFTRWWLRW